jgi:hypothetical protein
VLARGHLQRAKDELHLVKDDLVANNQIKAHGELAIADHEADAAQHDTSGPIWAVAAKVPWLGAPLRTERGVASAASELTSTSLPRLVSVAQTLSPSRLRTAPNRIDIHLLSAAQPTLSAVDTSAAAVVQKADNLPHHTWLSAADDGRAQFSDLVRQLHDTVHTAATAAGLLPPMLGADGPRRYLLVIQTNAESRGLGGLPGVFAVIRANNGRISFERFGNDTDITGRAQVNLGRDYARWYTQFGTEQMFVNSTASPDFPSVAQLWMSFWRHTFHQRLDGAIATDPVALSYLLGASGPATLPDGTSVSADNAVQLIESDAYAKYRNTTRRKAFFVEVGRVVADHVLHGGAGGSALISALGKAVGERRLLVWSAHSDEEHRLAGQPLGGLIPRTTAPFTALVVNNAAGSKLDYYLDRRLTYALGPCDGNSRSSTVTAILHNAAPTSGLPPYVVIRSDDPEQRVRPGTERLLVTIYGTTGARLRAVSIDGRSTNQVFRAQEAGHPMFTVTVEIPPQKSVTVRLQLTEPRRDGPVVTLKQPLVRPLSQQVTRTAC